MREKPIMAQATSSAVPEALRHHTSPDQSPAELQDHESTESSKPKKPEKMAEHARLRIHLDDLARPASRNLVRLLDVATLIRNAIDRVHDHLYTPYGKPKPVRSVTLVIRMMDGVAYTDSLSLDEEHKEIHFSLNHLSNIMEKSDDLGFIYECLGVITHEMVHCFQHNAKDTAPGWLIEGIADFVRLKSGLAAPHWEKGSTEETRGKDWKQGYQKTAWFLDFLESKFGPGTISRMNAFMWSSKYEDREFWPKLFHGKSVEQLWEKYKMTWSDEEENQRAEVGPARAAALVAEEVMKYAEETAAKSTALAGAARQSARSFSETGRKPISTQVDPEILVQ